VQEIASCILRWLKVTQEASPHFSSMKHRLINTRTACLERTESLWKTHHVRQEALPISLSTTEVLASREPNFIGTCVRSARGNREALSRQSRDGLPLGNQISLENATNYMHLLYARRNVTKFAVHLRFDSKCVRKARQEKLSA